MSLFVNNQCYTTWRIGMFFSRDSSDAGVKAGLPSPFLYVDPGFYLSNLQTMSKRKQSTLHAWNTRKSKKSATDHPIG